MVVVNHLGGSGPDQDQPPSTAADRLEPEDTAWRIKDESLLWQDSSEHRRLFGSPGDGATNYREGAGLALAAAAVLVVLALLSAVAAEAELLRSSRAGDLVLRRLVPVLTLSLAVLLLSWVVACYSAARKAFYDRVRLLKARMVAEAVEELGKGLNLERLFVLNRKQLDEYHVLSVRQASIAFRNATTATMVAFAVLLAGALLAVQPHQDDSSRYVAGGLSALGATLSAFLSRNFFDSYRETAKELKDFYQEPARTGQLLALERLARDEAQPATINPELRRLMLEHLLNSLAPRRHKDPDVLTTSKGADTPPG
jgi:hypothetical protein